MRVAGMSSGNGLRNCNKDPPNAQIFCICTINIMKLYQKDKEKLATAPDKNICLLKP